MRWVQVICLFLLFAVCAVPQSQQEKEIIKAFNKAVSDYIPSHIDPREPRIYGNGSGSCGWIKQYFRASTDYSIDVRRTDSIISPYIGTVQFAVSNYKSACHKTREEAEKDNRLETDCSTQTDCSTHKYTFAYQDEKWVIKSRELKFKSDEWYPCGPHSDGCL